MSEAEDFLKIGTDEWPSPAMDEIRLSKKALLITASWIVGLLIACPDPRAIIYVITFPIGLVTGICRLCGNDNPPCANGILFTLWLMYATLVVVALAVPRKKWFYVVWTIMTLLLVLNGVSCHSELEGVRHL